MPLHQTERPQKIFDDLRDRKQAGQKQWECVLGELRFVLVAIPGSAGLFGPLQLALNYAKRGQICITNSVWDCLTKFNRLVRDVANWPTRLPC